ncbi:MAG: hypothetical protein ABJC26_15630 [Gemmatimonadaceae bacterium]
MSGRTYFQLGVYDAARSHLDSAYQNQLRTVGHNASVVGDLAADIGKGASIGRLWEGSSLSGASPWGAMILSSASARMVTIRLLSV